MINTSGASLVTGPPAYRLDDQHQAIIAKTAATTTTAAAATAATATTATTTTAAKATTAPTTAKTAKIVLLHCPDTTTQLLTEI